MEATALGAAVRRYPPKGKAATWQQSSKKPAVLPLPAVMKKEELAEEPPLKDKPILHGGESDDGDGDDDDKIGAMWPAEILRDPKEGLCPDEYVGKDEPEASADGSGPGKQDWWWLGLDDNVPFPPEFR